MREFVKSTKQPPRLHFPTQLVGINTVIKGPLEGYRHCNSPKYKILYLVYIIKYINNIYLI